MTITNSIKKLGFVLVAAMSMLMPTLAFASTSETSAAGVVGFTAGLFVVCAAIVVAMFFVLMALIKRETWE